ncbi:SDR family oxidoreductase [Arthrobacter sp. B0490]|uniref:SDR family oxidoreductase n=1 Tax=Arthrobacter sp. B0490 TaxID=2058891 RepID=UPI000CE31E3C|nr:SDR family oxidoreductase [Arthrobacter sp. B0490]
MTRTYVITGAASGIGLATKELLEERGHRVIGVDLRGSDIDADLSSVEARKSLPGLVEEAAGGSIDAVLAIAGVAVESALTVRVNYFGAVEVLELLRPLLAASEAPRAALIASFSTLQENDPELVSAMRLGDEARSAELADALAAAGKGHLIYASTKRAIAEWMREQSISPEWADAGIPLNGVAPGVIVTPMTAPYLATPEGRASLLSGVPIRLNGPADPIDVARLLAWLTGAENAHVTGQLIFLDGGAEVVVRGPEVFGGAKTERVVLKS